MNKNLKVSKITFESLKNIQPQSMMSVTPVENTGVTAEEAPYLPHIVAVGTKTLDDIALETAKETGDSFETCRFWWNSMIELVAEILTDGVHTEINFGYWSFALAIEGSVPSANAQPSAIANPVYIACYPSSELNRVAAELETKRNIAAQAFIVDQVFGVDTAKTRLVTAGNEMHVFGRKLSMGATGEKAELVKGESVYPLTYKNDTEDLPTRMDFEIPSNVPAGKEYVLRVTAFGKNSEKPEPEIVEKENITVLAAPEPTGPTITKVTSDGPVEDDHLAVSKNHVLGTGLALGEGDHVYLRLIDTDGTVLEDNSQDHRVTSSTDAEITSGDAGFWPDDSEYPDGEWDEEGRTVKLRVVKADGTSAERRVYLDDGE